MVLVLYRIAQSANQEFQGVPGVQRGYGRPWPLGSRKALCGTWGMCCCHPARRGGKKPQTSARMMLFYMPCGLAPETQGVGMVGFRWSGSI